MRRALYLLIGLVFLAGSPVWAQDTATIVGTVTDATGAVVPGAKVTVSNPDRGFLRDVASSSAGEYTAARIPIGNYVITAEATGFQKLVRSGITLTAGQTQRVDMTLKVGQVTQEVEVVGNVAKVETENATVSDVVTSKQIDNLALNGQNVMGLEFLVPGAAIGDGQESAMQLGHAGGGVLLLGLLGNLGLDGCRRFRCLVRRLAERELVWRRCRCGLLFGYFSLDMAFGTAITLLLAHGRCGFGQMLAEAVVVGTLRQDDLMGLGG